MYKLPFYIGHVLNDCRCVLKNKVPRKYLMYCVRQLSRKHIRSGYVQGLYIVKLSSRLGSISSKHCIPQPRKTKARSNDGEAGELKSMQKNHRHIGSSVSLSITRERSQRQPAPANIQAKTPNFG